LAERNFENGNGKPVTPIVIPEGNGALRRMAQEVSQTLGLRKARR